MSGRRLRLALVMLAGFAAVLVLITIGNAESMISDFRAANVPVPNRHVWIWQVTSVIAWVAVCMPIWWAVAWGRPPRFGWGAIAAIFVAGLLIASGLHIALMIVLRKAVYWAWEGASYHFQGNLEHPYVYEFRKDIATYLQFVLVALAGQWLLAKVDMSEAAVVDGEAPVLLVQEGSATHRIPVDEIEWIAAAGNYVELPWRGRSLLHRATLAAVEEELGDRFVRIHRSRLVRRAAIRSVETNQAGDFEVTLDSGEVVKGSRRYRAGLG